MRMRNLILLAGLCALASAANARAQSSEIQAPADMPAFRHAPLTPAALEAHVARLSADIFEGRAVGEKGEDLTLDYIVRAFAAAGLAPGGDTLADGRRDWRQAAAATSVVLTNRPLLTVAYGREARPYAFEDDLMCWSGAGAPQAAIDNAPLVFVGYGHTDPDQVWQDYGGADMRGKIVLILANDADFDTGDDRGFGGETLSAAGRWTEKFAAAARAGAAGALIIHDAAATGLTWRATRYAFEDPVTRASDDPAAGLAVQGWLRKGAAADIFARAGLSLEAETARAKRPDFSPRVLAARASIQLESSIEAIVTHNVVGVLPGRSRADEAVVFAAPWDGRGPCTPVAGDGLCNSAVDSGVGVAGLIELARRFAGMGRAERSVVFVATTGHLGGGFGARAYVRAAPIAIEKTAGVVGLERLNAMGPSRDIALIEAGANGLTEAVAALAAAHGRAVRNDPVPALGGLMGSDVAAFAAAGAPALLLGPGLDLHSGGEERGAGLWRNYLIERYQQPDDEWDETWDLTGAMQDLLIVHEAGEALANSGVWPQWRGSSAFARARRASARERR